MRKGIFIPDITVKMFKNASLEAVEKLLVSGTMEDIEIPDRPHGEWILTMRGCSLRRECSVCGESFNADGKKHKYCSMCGASMVSLNSEIVKSKSEIVPDYRDGWRLREGENNE